MEKELNGQEETSMKKALFGSAVKALEEDGWKVERIAGRGKSSLRLITRGNERRVISIRTTRDQWIAFPRDAEDKGWGTLDEVDSVVAASVDDRENPRFAQIHLIDGNDMRDRFNRAYAARQAAGHTIQAGRGIWIGLYGEETPNKPGFVGAGAGNAYPAFARIPLNNAATEGPSPAPNPTTPVLTPMETDLETQDKKNPLQVIAQSKLRIAAAFGVDSSKVKITIEGM